MLAEYNKFLFIEPYKILIINLAINLKSLIILLAFNIIIYLRLHIIAKAQHY